MSIIRLHPAPLPDDPFAALEEDPVWAWAGSFDTETAEFWQSSEEDDTTRVWRTPSGRWVMTTRAWDSYIARDEAHKWLRRHGHADAIREHDGPGRPEVGPCVKVRLPEETLADVDAMAERNGVSRAAQIRAMIMDTARP
jgi:hypothetical protein